MEGISACSSIRLAAAVAVCKLSPDALLLAMQSDLSRYLYGSGLLLVSLRPCMDSWKAYVLCLHIPSGFSGGCITIKKNAQMDSGVH